MKTTPTRRGRSRFQEPSSAWIWIAFFLLASLSVPFLFAGQVEPLLFNIPLWFLLSLLCYLLIATLVAYVIVRRWSLAEPILGEEE